MNNGLANVANTKKILAFRIRVHSVRPNGGSRCGCRLHQSGPNPTVSGSLAAIMAERVGAHVADRFSGGTSDPSLGVFSDRK